MSLPTTKPSWMATNCEDKTFTRAHDFKRYGANPPFLQQNTATVMEHECARTGSRLCATLHVTISMQGSTQTGHALRLYAVTLCLQEDTDF